MNFTSPPPPDEAPLLDWALWYASQGWPVFPCYGKKPIGLPDVAPNGFYDATDDEARIKKWWAQWPMANIGIPVKGNRVVLDVDPRKGGDTQLYTLQQQHGPLPDTLTSHTGGGGLHLTFRTTVVVQNKADLGGGIDVQAVGSYVIAPPSVHPDTGKRYLWDAAYGPDAIDPQPAPAWLENLIKQAEKPSAPPTPARDPQAPIPEGVREKTLMTIAGAMQRVGSSQEAIRQALNAENARCVPPLEAHDLDRMTRSVGRYAPAPHLSVGTEALHAMQQLWLHDTQDIPWSLQLLRVYWHADICGAWRSGKEPVIWWLCLQSSHGEQEICLGRTIQLQDQKHVRACFLESTGNMPPFLPAKQRAEWDTCLKALAEIARERDEPENDPASQARELVRSYLDSKPATFRMDFDEEEWQRCARQNQPFRQNGAIHIHCRQWHIEYVRHVTDLTYADALACLRKLGANTLIRLPHPRTSRYYWKIAATTFYDAEGDQHVAT